MLIVIEPLFIPHNGLFWIETQPNPYVQVFWFVEYLTAEEIGQLLGGN